MSKRSSFPKVPKDFYPTIDPRAGGKILPHIKGLKYAEPFYGEGDLEDQLVGKCQCVWRSDIREVKCTSQYARVCDALDLTEEDLSEADCIISNPPYTWKVLQPLIDHLVPLKPCWFLLPMDMLSNKYMAPYGKGWLQKVVPVGRLYWLENKVRGTDNYGWFFFEDRGTVYDNTVRIIYDE